MTYSRYVIEKKVNRSVDHGIAHTICTVTITIRKQLELMFLNSFCNLTIYCRKQVVKYVTSVINLPSFRNSK